MGAIQKKGRKKGTYVEERKRRNMVYRERERLSTVRASREKERTAEKVYKAQFRRKRVREAGESVVASCKRGDSGERLLILNPHRAFENYQSSYHRRRAAYANCCGVERLNGKLLDSIFFSVFPLPLPLSCSLPHRKPVLSLR